MAEKQETLNTAPDDIGTEDSEGRWVSEGGVARRCWRCRMSASGRLGTCASPAGSPGTQEPLFHSGHDKTVHWGYFSRSLKPLVEIDSGDLVTIETLTHHACDDYDRMISGDPGAESVYPLDQGQKERRPPRRRSDGRHGVRARRRRRLRRPHLHRTGRGARRRARRPARSADRRHQAAAGANPAYKRQGLRQQRGNLVGLSVRRAADRAEAARGDHDLRGRCERRKELGAGRLQLPLGRRRPIRSGWSTRSSIIPACRSTTA